MILLPICYAAPIAYYYYLVNFPCQIEIFASYQKQTYANRCYIATSNGIEALSIPVEKNSGKTLIKDIKVSNTTNWQTLHYRAISSAYSSSPFFEYFTDYIYTIYSKRYDFLSDFNLDLQAKVIELLNYKDLNISLSHRYLSNEDKAYLDLREEFSAKKPFLELPNIINKPYHQVFSYKYDFIPNLSIFDLLFNIGHEARIYLQTV